MVVLELKYEGGVKQNIKRIGEIFLVPELRLILAKSSQIVRSKMTVCYISITSGDRISFSVGRFEYKRYAEIYYEVSVEATKKARRYSEPL